MTFKPSKIQVSSLVGRAVAGAEEKFDGQLAELRIAVGHRKPDGNGGYEDAGTTWVTYKASGEYAASLKAVGKGDLVEITDAILASREWESNGEKRSALEARFGTLTILERKGEGKGGSAPAKPATPATDDEW
jgi:single-stranded DNA-binding protein